MSLVQLLGQTNSQMQHPLALQYDPLGYIPESTKNYLQDQWDHDLSWLIHIFKHSKIVTGCSF